MRTGGIFPPTSFLINLLINLAKEKKMSKNENMFTTEYGIEKGFLESKTLTLKPIPRGNKMITDPNHVGYFMWEGASMLFCLTRNEYNELVNPFKSEDEQRFFSEVLDLDLNVHKKADNFWNSFYVKISKDHKLMSEGITYNLANPMDNLRVRVLKQQKEVAPSWEKRYDRISYKFAFVDNSVEVEEEEREMDKMETIWTYWGTIKGSPKKMKEFLGIYWMEKKALKNVPKDATREFLTTEIKKLIQDDSDLVYKIIEDPKAELKYLIYRGIQVGAITREGVNTYQLVGDDEKFTLLRFIEHLEFLKETTDPIYQKLEAQINSSNK